MGEAVEVVREQTEHNAHTAEAFARGIGRQQENMRALSRDWAGAYRAFISPFSYVQEGMRSFQRATKQGLETTEQLARQGLRALRGHPPGIAGSREATERTEGVMRQTEKVTREAELRTAVLAALKSTDYEGLRVEEISKRIEGLPTAAA